MSFRRAVRNWIRRRRMRRAARRQQAELREFVYLDEISVYSLIASRVGPVATELTQTEQSTLSNEVSGSIGVNLGGPKAEVSTRALNGHSTGSQVLRKSLVQTTFKDLYELEEKKLAIRPIPSTTIAPTVEALSHAELGSLVRDGWVAKPDQLKRGRLLELEVELETEPVFRVSAVASALLGITKNSPEVFGLVHDSFRQVETVHQILEKLLAGLVPVRGRSLDYDVVVLDGKEWLVHRKILSQIPDEALAGRRPAYVVGVADHSLFWKDIRRVLFSESRFRVLCRLAQDGLQATWTPIKLAQVLDVVTPDLGKKLDSAGRDALSTMKSKASASERASKEAEVRVRAALVEYAHQLLKGHGFDDVDNQLAEQSVSDTNAAASLDSLDKRRAAFERVSRHLSEQHGIEPDPVEAASYRTAALVMAGMDLDGKPTAVSELDGRSRRDGDIEDEAYLDAEFVAIYW